jgi:hypothetical protein
VNATGAIVGNVAVGGAGGGDAVFGSALYGGVNPVKTAKLQLNAHDRFSQRDGKYFNQVQPYQHTNMPAVGINMYSFALKPRSTSLPALATCPALITPLFSSSSLRWLRVLRCPYATNYNVLRI